MRFLENNLDRTLINNNGTVSQFTRETLLPNLGDDPIFLPDTGQLESWHIYELPPNNLDKDKNFKFPPLNRLSLEEIDELYQYLSQKYLWCFFPWGTVGSFFGFAFISSDKYLRDRLIDVINNLDMVVKYPNTPDFKPRCISTYDVTKNLSELIQCIIFDVEIDWLGMRVWKLSKLVDSYPPLIIRNNLNYSLRQHLSNYILDLSIDIDNLFVYDNSLNEENKDLQNRINLAYKNFWENSKWDIPNFYQKEYKNIGIAKCFDECEKIVNVFDIEQWNNQIYFNQICRYYRGADFNTTIIVPIPKFNNFKSLQNILSFIGNSKYGTSDDLIMMSELLNQAEWLFGICRLLENGENNCIFMSKNNHLVRLFMKIEYCDGFSLISCF